MQLRMWFQIKWHCKTVHGCKVYTERAPRRQQFDVAPAMSTTKQSCNYTTLMGIQNALCEPQSLIHSRIQLERSGSSRKQRMAL